MYGVFSASLSIFCVAVYFRCCSSFRFRPWGMLFFSYFLLFRRVFKPSKRSIAVLHVFFLLFFSLILFTIRMYVCLFSFFFRYFCIDFYLLVSLIFSFRTCLTIRSHTLFVFGVFSDSSFNHPVARRLHQVVMLISILCIKNVQYCPYINLFYLYLKKNTVKSLKLNTNITV